MDMTRDELAALGAMDDTTTTGVALPGGVVTFLLSDVEGSTRLWEGDESEMGAAIARHYELLDAAVLLHGGVRPVEQGEGDSVVGAFTNPSDAVAAALEAQRAFAAETWPGGRELRIRIALHTGQAQLRGSGYYVGRAVIRCARLRAVAHGGQTVLSAATRDLVGDRLPEGISLRDLGSHRLKDLGEPERIWQLCHPDLADDFGPLRSLDAVNNNLPAQLTSFVGRDGELAELRVVLADARLVALTGAGGCGKTRLAAHAAAEVAEAHPDGVWWVELGPLADPGLVAITVARTLGVREEETRPILDTLCERAANLDALVVLDNCEHLTDACAEVVERLLGAAPAVRILATSREPLGVPGERTWRVPSLTGASAARLFMERAAQVRRDFAPGDEELATITSICERLDGIPLAIELAAARSRMMPPAKIAAGLDDRFRLLTGGGRRALPRQQTLEMSVAWSHDLLSEDERVLLRRLSVFVGGFTLESAEAACSADPVDPYAVLDLVANLVDKSLVQADHDAEGRYRLSETLRLYAAQRLLSAGEADATRDAHLGYFVGLAEELEPEIVRSDGPSCLARLEREHDNLRAAMEWADSTDADEAFLRLTTSLTIFWELHGHMQTGGGWAARALQHPGEASPARARALWGAAHLALYRGDGPGIERYILPALSMAEEVGDSRALARILNTHGLLQALSEPAAAHATLDRSIALAKSLGDDWAVGDGWKMRTCAHLFAEDFDGLAKANRELLAVAQRLGNRFFTGWYFCAAGWASVRRGELSDADSALRQALHADELLGGASTAGIADMLLAEAEALSGRPVDAEARVRAFLNRRPSFGGRERGLYPDDFGLQVGIPTLGQLLVARGEPGEARDLMAPFAQALQDVGVPPFLAWALWVLGGAYAGAGDYDTARETLRQARTVAAEVGSPWSTAHADHRLGAVAHRGGDLAAAEDLHHQALAVRTGRGLMPGVVDSLEALAGIGTDQESFTEATRLYAAADRMRRMLGLHRWLSDLTTHETELDRLRKALGGSAFDTAWGEGTGLGLGEAVAYATRARGERKRPSSGWGSLTPTELDVVKLAAQGMTNPDIAERMFIGRGTVKTHLAHVFDKLGVASRAELAAEATRRSL
jgi:predicted ATPase/class 3 adenylate cyclase/DNA-binding CsgD family transcriptional regulator